MIVGPAFAHLYARGISVLFLPYYYRLQLGRRQHESYATPHAAKFPTLAEMMITSLSFQRAFERSDAGH